MRSHDEDENASQYLAKANDLKTQINEMTEEVKKRINHETDDAIKDAVEQKEKEINDLEQKSNEANDQAAKAKEHIDQAQVQLNRIKKLVEDMSGRKLNDLIVQLNTHHRTEGITKELEGAEKQYERLLNVFNNFKADQQAKQAEIQSKLRKDEENMANLKTKQEQLKQELERLEEIESVLPQWCQ